MYQNSPYPYLIPRNGGIGHRKRPLDFTGYNGLIENASGFIHYMIELVTCEQCAKTYIAGYLQNYLLDWLIKQTNAIVSCVRVLLCPPARLGIKR
jgi:hypothetical protein